MTRAASGASGRAWGVLIGCDRWRVRNAAAAPGLSAICPLVACKDLVTAGACARSGRGGVQYSARPCRPSEARRCRRAAATSAAHQQPASAGGPGPRARLHAGALQPSGGPRVRVPRPERARDARRAGGDAAERAGDRSRGPGPGGMGVSGAGLLRPARPGRDRVHRSVLGGSACPRAAARRRRLGDQALPRRGADLRGRGGGPAPSPWRDAGARGCGPVRRDHRSPRPLPGLCRHGQPRADGAGVRDPAPADGLRPGAAPRGDLRAGVGLRDGARDRSVDVFVRKLRQKLRAASPRWNYIHTHFGVGYRFAPEREDAVEQELDLVASASAAASSTPR